jgi:DNA-binding response OmpR family regulator
VDDEPGIRATLPLVLERHGFHVSAAATVQEALELIRTAGFDLLICDLNIQQDRDGYAVIREMRSANPPASFFTARRLALFAFCRRY